MSARTFMQDHYDDVFLLSAFEPPPPRVRGCGAGPGRRVTSQKYKMLPEQTMGRRLLQKLLLMTMSPSRSNPCGQR